MGVLRLQQERYSAVARRFSTTSLTDAGNRLIVTLRGESQNTDAIGAIVRVRAGELTQMRLVQSGTSYLSQHDKRQHFGLGTATEVDWVDVRWPDGTTARRKNVRAEPDRADRELRAGYPGCTDR